MQIDLCT